jgi:hypothetical protein
MLHAIAVAKQGACCVLHAMQQCCKCCWNQQPFSWTVQEASGK